MVIVLILFSTYMYSTICFNAPPHNVFPCVMIPLCPCTPYPGCPPLRLSLLLFFSALRMEIWFLRKKTFLVRLYKETYLTPAGQLFQTHTLHPVGGPGECSSSCVRSINGHGNPEPCRHDLHTLWGLPGTKQRVSHPFPYPFTISFV